MKLQFDVTKTYALALEGGGAKGAWQIGAWRALEEAGVKYNAVSGTSVGALNGAMMAMRDLPRAEALWRDIRYSSVMDVSDEDIRRLKRGEFWNLDLAAMSQSVSAILKGGGLDVEPLKRLIRETANEEAIRNSDVRFFFVTYCITDKKTLELEAARLPEGSLADMLLASAYFPAFRHDPIGGKMYTDGGARDVLPLHALYENGYRDIIALRIHGFGRERILRKPADARVTVIEPGQDTGSMLEFDSTRARRNMLLGYFDTQRLLYGLSGNFYYIDRTMTEKDAYHILCRMVEEAAPDRVGTLRSLHEEALPRLARQCGGSGDYYSVLVALMEKAAKKRKIEELCVMTDLELLHKIRASVSTLARKPGLLRYFSA